jgi:hypothetical protein
MAVSVAGQSKYPRHRCSACEAVDAAICGKWNVRQRNVRACQCSMKCWWARARDDWCGNEMAIINGVLVVLLASQSMVLARRCEIVVKGDFQYGEAGFAPIVLLMHCGDEGVRRIVLIRSWYIKPTNIGFESMRILRANVWWAKLRRVRARCCGRFAYVRWSRRWAPARSRGGSRASYDANWSNVHSSRADILIWLSIPEWRWYNIHRRQRRTIRRAFCGEMRREVMIYHC